MFLLPLLLLLFPIAAYCVVLAILNRRPQPALVAGSWDFLGLLFAASGLLLYTGPKLVSRYFQQEANGLPFEEGGPSPDAAGALAAWWLLAWAAYYAVVVGGAAFLVWWRRDKTVVYNIAAADLDRALAQTFARLGVDGTRSGNRFYLGFGGALAARPEPVPGPLVTAVTAAPLPDGGLAPPLAPAKAPAGEAVLDVEPFAPLWNVTLHWRNHSGPLRREVEAALANELKEVRTYDNPVGAWFLGTAGFLLALTFMVVMVLILNVFVPRR